MGLYIKGMKIPKEGRITIQIGADGAVYTVTSCKIAAEAYEKKCSAIEVTEPCGRLIDADAFIGTIRPLCEEDKYAACTFETVKRLMLEHINNAPTIIPASKEG